MPDEYTASGSMPISMNSEGEQEFSYEYSGGGHVIICGEPPDISALCYPFLMLGIRVVILTPASLDIASVYKQEWASKGIPEDCVTHVKSLSTSRNSLVKAGVQTSRGCVIFNDTSLGLNGDTSCGHAILTCMLIIDACKARPDFSKVRGNRCGGGVGWGGGGMQY